MASPFVLNHHKMKIMKEKVKRDVNMYIEIENYKFRRGQNVKLINKI